MYTWRNINQILRKIQLNTSKIADALEVDSKLITDPTQICNKVNKHFVTVGEKLCFRMTAPKKNCLKNLGKRQVSSVVLLPTNAYEIIETTADLKIKNNKSPDYINITVTLIKEAKVHYKTLPSHVIQEMFRKGNFPDILIIAKVVPFHKDECQIDHSK